MTYVLLHADRLRSVATDDPLVPAAQVPALRDATALLFEAGRLRDVAEADIASARAEAQRQGFAHGEAAGRAAAEAELTQALARIEASATAREAQRRDDIARLAIEVVRKIAGEIDPATLIAGIARRAAAGVTDDAGATVRVAPAQVDGVRARLADRNGLTVEADAALGPLDCLIETPLGRTYAGLDTQLEALDRGWAQG